MTYYKTQTDYFNKNIVILARLLHYTAYILAKPHNKQVILEIRCGMYVCIYVL